MTRAEIGVCLIEVDEAAALLAGLADKQRTLLARLESEAEGYERKVVRSLLASFERTLMLYAAVACGWKPSWEPRQMRTLRKRPPRAAAGLFYLGRQFKHG